ncbi:ribonucleoside-diphosphate reductase 2 alpha chain [Escherichia coli]|uniref:Ribonucleoside-diphosphate reductase 2 alpha chain n=1 Tax=Escherichia coli TaxID=562 RepID=A0A377K1W6_ECOLX|nr:ribonucleoside-diphosphate reductase 2 alpha chain [Escherichia coli]
MSPSVNTMTNWVADERIRKKNTSTPVISSSDWQKSSFESGYPYIMYEDTVNRANPIAGRINMSNLCSEILPG